MFSRCKGNFFLESAFIIAPIKGVESVVKCKIFLFKCASNDLKEHKNAFRVDKKVIKVRFLILYT